MPVWLPHAALIPIYWIGPGPFAFPYPSSLYPSSLVSTTGTSRFGGFGLTRNASAASMQFSPPTQRPPGSLSCREDWLGPAYDSGPGAGQPVGVDRDTRPGWPAGSSPALATRRWSSKAMRTRSGWLRAASIRCSLPGVVFPFSKPLSQKHRSTFLPLQHTVTLIFSVDSGLGYRSTKVSCEPNSMLAISQAMAMFFRICDDDMFVPSHHPFPKSTALSRRCTKSYNPSRV